MSAKRKLWSTTWVDAPGNRDAHRSEKATYEWLAEMAKLLRLGQIDSPVLDVWVDDRLGQGWMLFERFDLREHAAYQRNYPGVK